MGQSHSHHTDHQMLSFVDVRPYLLIERVAGMDTRNLGTIHLVVKCTLLAGLRRRPRLMVICIGWA